MTSELIELLQESIAELGKIGSELRTLLQTALITYRHPAAIVRDIDAKDFPDAAVLKKSLTTLHAILEHTQEVVMRAIDKITVASGTTQMLIDEMGEGNE